MAIYSCNLRSIGRTTHDPGTAGAHIRYISRPDAEPTIIAEHIPRDPVSARTWLDRCERAMRKNARVIDKVRIALPRELDGAARAELVRAFMRDIGDDRVPWFAAIHQTGSDAHNPHVHIAVHDRDIHTGRRLLRLSDNARDRTEAGLPGPKAVNWIRERWEVVCNDALARAGVAARIDKRTLEAQGIDRAPTIHEGPRAQHINDRVKRPRSKKRVNGCGREIDYVAIDQGRTRREFNAHVIDLNLERAARSGNPARVLWAEFEKDQIAQDRELEARLAGERHERTTELRTTALLYASRIKQLRSERQLKARSAIKRVKERNDPLRRAMRLRHAQQRQELTDKQSRLHLRILTKIDFTGRTRRRQEAARKALSVLHRAERTGFSERYKAERKLAEIAVKGRVDELIQAEQMKRLQHLSTLKDLHGQAEAFGDLERQKREADREHMRSVTEGKIDAWKQRERVGDAKSSDAFARAAARTARRNRLERKGPDAGREM